MAEFYVATNGVTRMPVREVQSVAQNDAAVFGRGMQVIPITWAQARQLRRTDWTAVNAAFSQIRLDNKAVGRCGPVRHSASHCK